MPRIALTLLFAILIHSQTLCAPVPVERWSAEKDAEFEKLWNAIDWYQPNAVKFWCRVHANPQAGYAFLDRKIEPIQMSEVTAKRLIDNLGSDDERVWKAAEARLKKRDIRLAMNFLNAWDYAETDLKRKRLLPLVLDNGYMDNLGFYDVTLTQQIPGVGQPICYSLSTKLRPGISRDVQLVLDLHGGFGMGFGADLLTTPDDFKVRSELALLPYLNGFFLDRLSRGNPSVEPAKSLLASSAKKTPVRYRSLGQSLSSGQLPNLWDKWCTDWNDPDRLTQKMLLCPELTVAFLAQRLKPICINPIRVGLLLSLLAHPSDAIWEKAHEQLQKADPRFCLSVEAIWQTATTVEQKRRLTLLLCPEIAKEKCYDYKLERYKSGKTHWVSISYWVRKDLPPEEIPAERRGLNESWGSSISDKPLQISQAKWFREEAAIWVLEAIGTDDALAIVKRMAKGHPDARPTIAAKEVLARRDRK